MFIVPHGPLNSTFPLAARKYSSAIIHTRSESFEHIGCCFACDFFSDVQVYNRYQRLYFILYEQVPSLTHSGGLQT